MKRGSLGIGHRLLIAHLLLSALMLGAIELTLAPMLRHQLEKQQREHLERAVRTLAEDLRAGLEPGLAATRISRATGYRIGVVGVDGLLEADSSLPPESLHAAGFHADRPEVLAARADGAGEAIRTSVTTGIATRYLALALPDGRVIRAAVSLADLESSLGIIHRSLAWAALLGLVLAGFLGAAVTHIAGKSVRELTRAAERIASGERREIQVPKGPGEIGVVARALERLAAQIDVQFDKLRAERDLLDAVLGGMEEAVLVLRKDGRLLLANEAADRLLQLSERADDRPLVETMRFPALRDALEAAAQGVGSSLEFLLPGPPRRELVGRAAPLPRGGEAAVILVLRDLTELRRLEAVRRDFLSNASHELRTPVAAIRGYAETLAAGALDDREAAKRFLAGLERQATRLSALVADLLDLSRIESGGLELAPVRLELREALEPLLPLLEAERKQIDLQLEVEEGLAAHVDPRAVEMAVGNLIENAIKYTPAGGTVRVRALRSGRHARVEVEDDGPGIEARHLDRIFERFYRADEGRSREEGGTGLGLSIARNIAQRSGGEVGVESEPGRGSRFWVLFPAA